MRIATVPNNYYGKVFIALLRQFGKYHVDIRLCGRRKNRHEVYNNQSGEIKLEDATTIAIYVTLNNNRRRFN